MAENEEDFKHPEGKIQLLNGNVLDCYPLEQHLQMEGNELELDKTGAYLSAKHKPVLPQKEADELNEFETELFLKNAFLFLENRDRILTDSRMFLSPVPIQSGLAYTGTSGFRRPTLGIYIEWWLNCIQSNILDEDGMNGLVYHLAGSPLSGSNHCGVVYAKGETKVESLHNFFMMWTSFIDINCRYTEAKSLYQAYTLREVLEIFQKEHCNVVYEKDSYIFFLEQENKLLRRQLEEQKKYGRDLYERFRKQQLASKRTELEAYYADYCRLEEQTTERVKQIQSQRRELRKQLRDGVLDCIHYQLLWEPLRKERDELKYKLKRYGEDPLREMFPDIYFTVPDVERFLRGEEE